MGVGVSWNVTPHKPTEKKNMGLKRGLSVATDTGGEASPVTYVNVSKGCSRCDSHVFVVRGKDKAEVLAQVVILVQAVHGGVEQPRTAGQGVEVGFRGAGGPALVLLLLRAVRETAEDELP